MKTKHLLFSFILFIAASSACLAQCTTGARIAAGTYPSITLSTNSYIAAGDVVTVTGAFAGASYILCNDGTLNANVISGLGNSTNNGSITSNTTISTNNGYTLTNGSSTNSTASITSNGTITTGPLFNYGTINAQGATGDFASGANSYAFNNYGTMTAGRNITWNGAFNNTGCVTAGDSISVPGANSFTNGSSTNSTAQITTNGSISVSAYFVNYGIIYAKSDSGNVRQTNISGYSLTNNTTSYIVTDGDVNWPGGKIDNYGCMNVNRNFYMNQSTPSLLTNYAGAFISVYGNFTTNCNFTNNSCINIENGNFAAGKPGYTSTNAAGATIYVAGIDTVYGIFNQGTGSCIGSGCTPCGGACNAYVPAACVLATAVNELQSSASMFRVFPNPVSGMFIVQMGKNELSNSKYQVTIYNMLGGKVFQTTGNGKQATINLDAPDGIYFISLQTESGISTQRIIKQSK